MCNVSELVDSLPRTFRTNFERFPPSFRAFMNNRAQNAFARQHNPIVNEYARVGAVEQGSAVRDQVIK